MQYFLRTQRLRSDKKEQQTNGGRGKTTAPENGVEGRASTIRNLGSSTGFKMPRIKELVGGKALEPAAKNEA